MRAMVISIQRIRTGFAMSELPAKLASGSGTMAETYFTINHRTVGYP
jgi:hypothetical protein